MGREVKKEGERGWGERWEKRERGDGERGRERERERGAKRER